MDFGKNSSQTTKIPVSGLTDRQRAIREQARRELPALRKQAADAIATLQRLAKRAEQRS